MTETKHTPGPWAQRKKKGYRDIILSGDEDDDDTVVIAVAKSTMVSWETTLANTRLLAAAPEMLNACEYIYERLNSMPLASRSPEERWDELHGWIVDEFCPLLATAIAKAKGETNHD